MDLEKISKLLASSNIEDRKIGLHLLNNLEDVTEFKEKYGEKDPGQFTSWAMSLEYCEEIEQGIYIPGKHGWYYMSDDHFAIDTEKDYKFWKEDFPIDLSWNL